MSSDIINIYILHKAKYNPNAMLIFCIPAMTSGNTIRNSRWHENLANCKEVDMQWI